MPLRYQDSLAEGPHAHNSRSFRPLPCYRESMAKKPKRARTIRREAQRVALGIAGDREKLFKLGAGGSPERPIEVDSAAVVEVRALVVNCPRCAGEHTLVEHAAVTSVRGERLREVRLACRSCCLLYTSPSPRD